MIKWPTYLMLVDPWKHNLEFCHGSQWLTALLLSEIWVGVSAGCNYIRPLPLLRVMEQSIHPFSTSALRPWLHFTVCLEQANVQGLLQLCPQPGMLFIVNNLLGFFFSCLLWIICEQMVIVTEFSLQNCFINAFILKTSSLKHLPWLLILLWWNPSVLPVSLLAVLLGRALGNSATTHSPKVEELSGKSSAVLLFSFSGIKVIEQVRLKCCQSLSVKPSYGQIEKQ